jgi:hypothetical protein
VIAWSPITQISRETPKERVCSIPVRLYGLYVPISLIRTIEVNFRDGPSSSLKIFMQNGVAHNSLYFQEPLASRFLDQLRVYTPKNRCPRLFEIRYTDDDGPSSVLGRSALARDLGEAYWDIFGGFSKITKFVRDSADQIKSIFDQSTARTGIEPSRMSTNLDLSVSTDIDEAMNKFLLMTQKTNSSTKMGSSADKLQVDIDDMDHSYEIIGVENLLPSHHFRSAEIVINEERWGTFFDEQGRIKNYDEFKRQIFNLVGLPKIIYSFNVARFDVFAW